MSKEKKNIDLSSQPLNQPTGMRVRKLNKLKISGVIATILLVIAVLASLGIFTWYQQQLAPLDTNDSTQKKLVIEAGSSPQTIADLLRSEGIIRSSLAFKWHVRLSGTTASLQAGSYRLSPSMSVQDIVEHLTSGKTDSFSITFYPGSTLHDNTSKPDEKKTDVETMLMRAGYSQQEVDTALAATYDHPLLSTKPSDADLEGYIYGETYNFPSTATAEDIIEYALDEMYKVVEDNNLVVLYKKQGLTLHQGIILASIVQREVNESNDQAMVAGVFFNRLEKDMNLGSDVTYQYIADKTGVPRDPTLKSPYNTRINTGLPPGPIAVPGKTALLAVAMPVKSDNLFFLSGDDDKTYFGQTVEDHERNIVEHCKEKCLIL